MVRSGIDPGRDLLQKCVIMSTTPFLKVDLDALKRKILSISGDLSTVEAAIITINANIITINASIGAIETDLTTVEGEITSMPAFWMNNGSGGTLSAGDVVVVDAVTTRSVTTTTTANDPRPAAVVLTIGPTAPGEDVKVQFLGMADANADADAPGGTIVKGDPLTTHSTPKYLRKAESQTDNIIGIASENLAAGLDQIAVFMLPSFKREGIVLDILTASDASNVTLPNEPYADDNGPFVIVYDVENFIISFPVGGGILTAWGAAAPNRVCLTSVGAVITNSKADFSTNPDQIYVFSLRADSAGQAEQILFMSFLLTILNSYARNKTGIFDVEFEGLKTIDRQWLDAINELAIDVAVRVRKELHFDANDRLASAHWYWSASAVNTARHYAFNYSGDYLVTFAYSQLSTDGTFKHSVTKSLEYAGGLLDKIIQEVA